MPKQKGKGFPEEPFQLGTNDRWFKDSRSMGQMSFGGGKAKSKSNGKKGKK